ncbi:MAG: DNA polymerase III subunit alpha [Alphaproteobacteria bacterium]|nr:DNA polymerase III subunit alpha [Alphaproteobacteria bacterium]
MSGPGFIHLHVHSAYSLLEGALPLGRLVDMAVADGQPALGIADSANLFGALEFSEKAANKGVQPIIGCEVPIDFGDSEEVPSAEQRQSGKQTIVLVARTERGFTNLSRLVSRAYLDDSEVRTAIRPEWLDRESVEGLCCLTGGPEGVISEPLLRGHPGLGRARLLDLQKRFDQELFVELQRHGEPGSRQLEAELLAMAYELGLPLVATNEPFFPTRDEYESHDALLAIAEGSVVAQTQRRRLTAEHYLKTRAQMCELFADLPEALANTVDIARRCVYRPRTRPPILPTFAAHTALSSKEANQVEADELSRQARDGLSVRLTATGPAAQFSSSDYSERLEFELGIIRDMKFPGYFLIVADFIQWAKDKGIPVGPGRGSGAGSLVAYALTITDVDPIRYDLLFERFLNPERVSMPDFDIDFCQERREEVIGYVQQKYGHRQVAQIITFGTLQARAVLRDVGRVMQMPYGQVDRICKLIPANPANPVSLAEALEIEPRLRVMRDEDEQVADLLSVGQKLEGLYRHASTHAAGIVIGDRPLEELVPLYRDARSDMPVTQYSLKWVEPAGLVKFDFLGLKTLTVIEKALTMINGTGGKLRALDFPLEDGPTFKLLQLGETVGVFQLESGGMRRALVDMRPDRFEDLIALVALYRPGPMANIPSYCARKLGHEPVEYLHPALKPILEPTYGIITYQEQVQQIARDLAGYTLAEADLLRRAMGKKIRAEMDAQRDRFLSGALERGVTRGVADSIFSACAKFAEYGFNKSHSAPYALITYQTAWLKANHPVKFMAASMTLDIGNTEKLGEFKREVVRLGIPIIAPCINRSEAVFAVHGDAIHYGLCALKGVGRAVADHIVSTRGAVKFTSLADFASRIDPRLVNRRALEALVNAGAFDQIVASREQVFGAVDAIVATANRAATGRTEGSVDMFDAGEPDPIRLAADAEPWSASERLAREFSAIGFYLSAHPLDEFADLFEPLGVLRWVDFELAVRDGTSHGKLAATIVSRVDRKTRRGSTITILELSDSSGSFECVAFSEQVAKFGEVLVAGDLVLIEVGAENRPDGVRLTLARAEPLLPAVSKASKRLTIFAGDSGCLESVRARLETGGESDVRIVVIRKEGALEFEIELPGKYVVSPGLASALRSVPGVVDARLN